MRCRLSLLQALVNKWLLLYPALCLLTAIQAQGPCPENTFQCDITGHSTSYDDLYNNTYYTSEYENYYETSAEGENTYSDDYQPIQMECLPKRQVCDGFPDCIDGLDEANCTDTGVFWCGLSGSSKNVSSSKVCNDVVDCSDGSDECDCPGSIKCDSGETSSGFLCVPYHAVCDGNQDCDNNEDETTNCKRDDIFVCRDNTTEVMKSQVCDSNNDCGDIWASDECNCSYTHVCESGECINNHSLCDGKIDCFDGSDECDCADDVSKASFRCQGSKKCIDASKVCDGDLDCGSYYISSYLVMDCSDEMMGNCSTHYMCREAEDALNSRIITRDLQTCVQIRHRCDGIPHCTDNSDECDCIDSVHCPRNTEHTRSSDDIEAQQCLLRSNFCDKTSQCAGNTDERRSGFGFKCRINAIEATSQPCVLPQFMVNDGVTDCSDETDVCYRNGLQRCFECFDRSMLISNNQICDGIIDCPDLSDECLCDVMKTPLCDAICKTANTSICELGTFTCGVASQCNSTSPLTHDVEFSRICDGNDDCYNSLSKPDLHLDEDYCGGEAHGLARIKCPYGGDSSVLRPSHASRCDQRPECAGFIDECNDDDPCEDEAEYCKFVAPSTYHRGEKRFACPGGLNGRREIDLFGLPGAIVCDGFVDCAGLGEDEIFCPKRFNCTVGNVTIGGISMEKISIDVSQYCDGVSDCVDHMDEINCPEYFYCEDGNPFHVPRSARFDGKYDCEDKSDECPKEQLEATFASSTEMIANPVLVAMVWIMAAISLIGNLLVASYQIVILRKPSSIGNQKVAICNHVMILNLAVADLLTGVYLLLLGISSVKLSGIYCSQDKIWRTSDSCANLGLLNSIATEAAVVILVIMTAYRHLAVYRPFNTTLWGPKRVAAICACGWSLVILGVIWPRLDSMSDYFSESAWIPLPFFDSDIVRKDEIMTFIGRYEVITRNFSCNTDKTWDAIEYFVAHHDFVGKFAKFGYYSKHSVCIPNMLASSSDPGFFYSAGVTIFNSIAFIYVVIAYILVYKKATAKKRDPITYNQQGRSHDTRSQSAPLRAELSRDRDQSRKSTPVKAMQGRIFRLVASNLACWVPLTVMAVLKICSVQLSNDTYAVAAIVLLPITSAVNPLLYSNVVSEICTSIKKKIVKKSTVLLGRTSHDETLPVTENIPMTTRSNA